MKQAFLLVVALLTYSSQAYAQLPELFDANSVYILIDGELEAKTYSDRGLSGASRLRPGYQRLLEDARCNVFDVIVGVWPCGIHGLYPGT